jgi:hypothetical protein
MKNLLPKYLADAGALLMILLCCFELPSRSEFACVEKFIELGLRGCLGSELHLDN